MLILSKTWEAVGQERSKSRSSQERGLRTETYLDTEKTKLTPHEEVKSKQSTSNLLLKAVHIIQSLDDCINSLLPLFAIVTLVDLKQSILFAKHGSLLHSLIIL